MYVEMDNGNNSYMAHPLIISAHVSLQSPLCGLLYRGFCGSLGMILAVSGHNYGVVSIRGMFYI